MLGGAGRTYARGPTARTVALDRVLRCGRRARDRLFTGNCAGAPEWIAVQRGGGRHATPVRRATALRARSHHERHHCARCRRRGGTRGLQGPSVASRMAGAPRPHVRRTRLERPALAALDRRGQRTGRNLSGLSGSLNRPASSASGSGVELGLEAKLANRPWSLRLAYRIEQGRVDGDRRDTVEAFTLTAGYVLR